MVLANTSILVVEHVPQNGCHQHHCPQSKSQLPLASLRGSPRLASGSDQDSFKLLSLCGNLEHVRFCVHPLRAESLFPTHLWHFNMHPLLAFNARRSGVSSSQCRTPGMEAQCGAWTPCSLQRTSAVVIIFPFVIDIYPGVCVLTHGYIPPTCLIVVPSLHL